MSSSKNGTTVTLKNDLSVNFDAATYFSPVENLRNNTVDPNIDHIINFNADELSAADHRRLILFEAEKIGSHLDVLLDEIDWVLTDVTHQNDLLQQRSTFLDDVKRRMNQLDVVSNTEFQPTTVPTDETRSHTQKSTENLSAEKNGSVNGVVEEQKQNGRPAIKRPSLSDYQFTETTLAYLRAENDGLVEGIAEEKLQNVHPTARMPGLDDFSERTRLLLKNADNKNPDISLRPALPPRLEDYEFRSAAMRNFITGGFPSHQFLAPAPAPALPAASVSFKKLEDDLAVDTKKIKAAAKASKKSFGGSLTGSFIEEEKKTKALLGANPGVVSALRFDENMDDSTASFMSLKSDTSLISREQKLNPVSKLASSDIRSDVATQPAIGTLIDI